MSLWEAVLLGFLQGATEFLPVSSSGHLVLAQEMLGLRLPGVEFEIAVHLATLSAVVVVFRKRLATLLDGLWRREPGSWRYLGLLALATLPAAALGLAAEERIDALFENPRAVAWALLATGILLWSARWALGRGPRGRVGAREATIMGLAQAAALVPGISRSGTTVVAGLWGGVDPEEAAAFSFLMSLPAVLGAALLKGPEWGQGVGGPGWVALAVGSLTAAGVGILAIRTFVALLKSRAFHRFGPYCWVVGGGVLLFL